MRAKQVTDPLDDKARYRLVGGGGQLSWISSVSAHSDAGDDHSPSFSDFVHGFFIEDDHSESQLLDEDISDSCSAGGVESLSYCTESLLNTLKAATNNNADSYRNLILTHVLKAEETYSPFQSQRSLLRRKVMASLRELRHNAGICKTKWNSSGGVTSGNYEFIDVVQTNTLKSQNRYIVDLDFASQFEIARPSSQYAILLQCLPRVFVGRSDDLNTIVKVMSDSARRSLKSQDLAVPPWRKNRYMQNKWFENYKRTTNATAVGSIPVVTTAAVNGVMCRMLGFDDTASSRLFIRTR